MVDTTTGTGAAAPSILREDLHTLREDLDLIFNSGQLHSGLAALTNVYFLYFLENMFLSGLFISAAPLSLEQKFPRGSVGGFTRRLLPLKIHKFCADDLQSSNVNPIN